MAARYFSTTIGLVHVGGWIKDNTPNSEIVNLILSIRSLDAVALTMLTDEAPITKEDDNVRPE